MNGWTNGRIGLRDLSARAIAGENQEIGSVNFSVTS